MPWCKPCDFEGGFELFNVDAAGDPICPFCDERAFTWAVDKNGWE